MVLSLGLSYMAQTREKGDQGSDKGLVLMIMRSDWNGVSIL